VWILFVLLFTIVLTLVYGHFVANLLMCLQMTVTHNTEVIQ